ncbi:MAG: hypothetical protein JO359_08650, partial [Candidatus Eremiobacteraeota bacterium]|nr:hypothetical protein [Candidatus Eremiobacteraeota bacterium]
VRIVEVVNARHPGTATFCAIDGMDHLLFKEATPKAALDCSEVRMVKLYTQPG